MSGTGSIVGREYLRLADTIEWFDRYAAAGHKIAIRRDRTGARKVRFDDERERNMRSAVLFLQKWRAG